MKDTKITMSPAAYALILKLHEALREPDTRMDHWGNFHQSKNFYDGPVVFPGKEAFVAVQGVFTGATDQNIADIRKVAQNKRVVWVVVNAETWVKDGYVEFAAIFKDRADSQRFVETFKLDTKESNNDQ